MIVIKVDEDHIDAIYKVMLPHQLGRRNGKQPRDELYSAALQSICHEGLVGTYVNCTLNVTSDRADEEKFPC